MKFVFASDLHGDHFLYKELKKLVEQESNINLLLLGGDLFAHTRDLQSQISFVNGYFKDFVEEINTKIFFIPGNIDWPSAIDAINQLPPQSGIRQLDIEGVAINRNTLIVGYPNVTPSPLHRKDYERRDLDSDSISPVANS